MSAPRYPQYKDSGVQWLGEVPEHWGTERLDRLFNERREEPDENAELISAFINGQVTLRSNRPDQIIKNSGKELGYKKICRSDLVISGMNAHLGGLGISDSDGKASPVYIVLTPSKHIYEAYTSYLLRHYAVSGYIRSLVNTIRYNSADMKYADIRNLIMIYPPLPEQTAIAAYLDRETTKIDALVEEQGKLTTLLKEKRQAVISHAVTKGIDPSVPMKESGIEWLGEVPAHWGVKRLGHFCVASGGGTPARENLDFWNGDIPWITPKDMKAEYLADSEEKITELGVTSSSASIIQPNRVLIVMRSGILKHTIPVGINLVATTVNQDIKALDVSRELLPKFFMRLVQGLNTQLLFEWRKQGATVESLETELMFHTRVPVPLLQEQEEILRFLEQELVKIDDLLKEAEHAIDLLKERRSGLISAAVTGKIDVRGLVADEVSV